MFWNKGTILICTVISIILIFLTSMLAFAGISPADDLTETMEEARIINLPEGVNGQKDEFKIRNLLGKGDRQLLIKNSNSFKN